MRSIKEYAKALQTIKLLYATHKNHTAVAYGEAEKVLNTLHILPFEGETVGCVMYREIKMMLATQALAKGKTKEVGEKVAETFLWPRKLGVGKPFDNLIDCGMKIKQSYHARKSNRKNEGFLPFLNEAQSWLYVASEAQALGRVGKRLIKRKLDVSHNTVNKGIAELESSKHSSVGVLCPCIPVDPDGTLGSIETNKHAEIMNITNLSYVC